MDEAQVGYYSVRLIEEVGAAGDVSWYAEHPELEGCQAVGQTPDEALQNLERSREAWLAWAQQHGVEPPPPQLDPSMFIQYAIRKDAAKSRDVAADVGSKNKMTIPEAA